MTALHESARRQLTEWEPHDASQNALRHTYLAYLDAMPRACFRDCVPGHLTGSVIVFDAGLTHVLLTLHHRIGLWLQLGGHCEEQDLSLYEVAAREAREESGLDGLRLTPHPVQLDTHPVTCSLGVPTRHLDVRYAAVAQPGSDGLPPRLVRSDESLDLAWWPVDALPRETDHATLPTLIASGLAALRA